MFVCPPYILNAFAVDRQSKAQRHVLQPAEPPMALSEFCCKRRCRLRQILNTILSGRHSGQVSATMSIGLETGPCSGIQLALTQFRWC